MIFLKESGSTIEGDKVIKTYWDCIFTCKKGMIFNIVKVLDLKNDKLIEEDDSTGSFDLFHLSCCPGYNFSTRYLYYETKDGKKSTVYNSQNSLTACQGIMH